tara:strand:- start:49 stop:342 length:294 start_codon:yes stop_codon:yes gene_type:complete
MTHSNQPEYYTITSICPYDGQPTVIGIFEDMDAVSYRLKRLYTSCGDEYRIECHHLQTADSESEALQEQLISRTRCRNENDIKEKLYKEHLDSLKDD